MGRLLSLVTLVVALWAIDLYAFRGRYQVAVVEDISDYAQQFNGAVRRFVKQFSP